MDDLVEGLIKLMESPDSITGPINLGNPGEFTIRQLAEQVKDLTGSTSELINKALPLDDPLQRQPDITLAKEHLGWEPRVKLKQGLEQAIPYFKALL